MMWPCVKTFGMSATKVGLVTLSAPDAAGNFEHVKRAIDWLHTRHVTAKWAEHARNSAGYLAGTPRQLADDLHSLLADSDIDFILTTGGGTNANSVLPYLDPNQLRRYPKPVVGLSNTTVLLNYLTAASGIISFHGPVLIWNLGGEQPLDDYTERHFQRAIIGDMPLSVESENTWRWIKPGAAVGRIWGGNLWSLQQLIGTPYLPDMTGAVLFLEECFTELHNVAAALTHLDHSGLLRQLSGLVVGVPLECSEKELPDGRDFDQVVADACEAYEFPILAGVHLGHTDRKITIPIGATAYLNALTNELRFEPT